VVADRTSRYDLTSDPTNQDEVIRCRYNTATGDVFIKDYRNDLCPDNVSESIHSTSTLLRSDSIFPAESHFAASADGLSCPQAPVAGCGDTYENSNIYFKRSIRGRRGIPLTAAQKRIRQLQWKPSRRQPKLPKLSRRQ
jgi:hypothetical protein